MGYLAPREKMAKAGIKALTDAELLAMLLRTGSASIPAVELSSALLKDFGGLRGLLLADRRTLEQQHGMGPAKSAQLLAVLELSKRYLHEVLLRSDPLESPGATEQYLKSALGDNPNEVFACLFLDTRHRVIAYEELFHGTIAGPSVYPRLLAVKATNPTSAALPRAHTHPSAPSEPTQPRPRREHPGNHVGDHNRSAPWGRGGGRH